jgi:hypothetical protein
MKRAAILPAAAVLLAACNAKPMPGNLLGTYEVTAHTQNNSCGAGLAAADPWVFTVELSQDGTTLYWNTLDGSPMLSGPVDAHEHATMTSSTTENMDGTEAGLGPCNMQRTDSLTVALGAGTPPATFSATFTYGFAAQTGSDCSDQMSSAGGPYDAIPCTLGYTATATLR